MVGNEELFTLETVKEHVDQLWAKVFGSVNTLLLQTKVFGYHGIEKIPSPNIHQMLAHLQLLNGVIDVLINNSDAFGLEYEQTRPLLNCKVQITNMEQLAAALKAQNRNDYDAAVKALEAQAPF